MDERKRLELEIEPLDARGAFFDGGGREFTPPRRRARAGCDGHCEVPPQAISPRVHRRSATVVRAAATALGDSARSDGLGHQRRRGRGLVGVVRGRAALAVLRRRFRLGVGDVVTERAEAVTERVELVLVAEDVEPLQSRDGATAS